MTTSENLNIQESSVQEMYCTIVVDTNTICALPLKYDDAAFQNGRCQQHCRISLDDGTLCSLPCMPNGFCFRHGGKEEERGLQKYGETGGIAESRASLLTEQEATIYELALHDPEALGHRQDLALIEVRIQQLMRESTEWKSEELLTAILKELDTVSRKMKKAVARIADGEGKAKGIAELNELVMLADLHTLINHSLDIYSNWAERDKWLARRKQIADSERRRLVSQQKVITGERAMAAIESIQVALKQSVNEHVDKGTARLIMSSFAKRVREVVGF